MTSHMTYKEVRLIFSPSARKGAATKCAQSFTFCCKLNLFKAVVCTVVLKTDKSFVPCQQDENFIHVLTTKGDISGDTPRNCFELSTACYTRGRQRSTKPATVPYRCFTADVCRLHSPRGCSDLQDMSSGEWVRRGRCGLGLKLNCASVDILINKSMEGEM